MPLLDTIGHCLEASLAVEQPSSIKEQVKRAGKSPKLVALMRCLPSVLRRELLVAASSDTLPFHDLEEVPFDYGFESVVYRTKDKQSVVKWHHNGDNGLASLDQRKAIYDMYTDCFGEQVLKTSFLIAESQYGHGAIVASVQPYMEGGLPLFENIGKADKSELNALNIGKQMMISRYNSYPDFVTSSNVLVDRDGKLHIVDTGVAMEIDGPREYSPALYQHLDILAEAANVETVQFPLDLAS